MKKTEEGILGIKKKVKRKKAKRKQCVLSFCLPSGPPGRPAAISIPYRKSFKVCGQMLVAQVFNCLENGRRNERGKRVLKIM